jgi:hypothetical protein
MTVDLFDVVDQTPGSKVILYSPPAVPSHFQSQRGIRKKRQDIFSQLMDITGL